MFRDLSISRYIPINGLVLLYTPYFRLSRQFLGCHFRQHINCFQLVHMQGVDDESEDEACNAEEGEEEEPRETDPIVAPPDVPPPKESKRPQEKETQKTSTAESDGGTTAESSKDTSAVDGTPRHEEATVREVYFGKH